MNVLFYMPVTGEVSERIHGVVEMVAKRAETDLVYTLLRKFLWG